MSKIILSAAAANAAADAVAQMLDGGFLAIYEGAQPTSADAALPRGTKLLATLKFGTPAFKPAEDGAAHANPMTPDKDAAATGRPQWFRLYRADEETSVYDGDITPGPAGALQMRALVVGQHAEVHIDSCVLRMPKAPDGART